MTTTDRKLLEKFDIPVSHLDFDYVKKCENKRELEKILMILRSGEEGYYPDLTAYTEDRLRELNPNSKMFRTEEPILTKESLPNQDWDEQSKSIDEWAFKVKEVDTLLTIARSESESQQQHIPPVREVKVADSSDSKTKSNSSKSNKIKSTDYDGWDKYDADTEELKIDLEEDRNRAKTEEKNTKHIKKLKTEDVAMPVTDLQHLTDVEKEIVAKNFKDRGNEYFRSKEYLEAAREYTRSINVIEMAACYNNRALVYLKLKDYRKCISDCEKCLAMEPKNLKALLRRGEAQISIGQLREAYEAFEEVLSIDVDNALAKKQINFLKQELKDLPPPNAKRMTIEESDSLETKTTNGRLEAPSKSGPSEKRSTKNSKSLPQEEDLAKLIVPNKIVKNKLSNAVKALEDVRKKAKDKPKCQPIRTSSNETGDNPDIRLLQEKLVPSNRVLIEEI